MAVVPVTINGLMMPKDKTVKPYPATFVGYAWITGLATDIDPPHEPSFHAFSFTVPASEAAASFVISGGEDIVRHGETSADAMREKTISALGQMEKRMQTLGVSWADTTATQVYTVHDLYPFLADEILRRGAARSGLTWHFNRPPVTGLEFEVDCRGVMYEQVVP